MTPLPPLRSFNWGRHLLAPLYVHPTEPRVTAPSGDWSRVLTEQAWAPLRAVLPRFSAFDWADLGVASPQRDARLAALLGEDLPPLVRLLRQAWPDGGPCSEAARCAMWDPSRCALSPAGASPFERGKPRGPLPACYLPPDPEGFLWENEQDRLMAAEMATVWRAGGWVVLVQDHD